MKVYSDLKHQLDDYKWHGFQPIKNWYSQLSKCYLYILYRWLILFYKKKYKYIGKNTLCLHLGLRRFTFFFSLKKMKYSHELGRGICILFNERSPQIFVVYIESKSRRVLFALITYLLLTVANLYLLSFEIICKSNILHVTKTNYPWYRRLDWFDLN